MLKRIFLILIILFMPKAFAIGLDDVTNVKDPAYRVGTSDEVELRYQVQDKVKVKKLKNDDNGMDARALTYADLSIKKMSNEISQNLELKQSDMMQDLSLLWQGAAVRSDTIKFALFKLSNPDADKPDEKSVKKVLSTIASMSTLVGAGSGNPLLATGAFLGSNMLGIMGQDDKSINYKYTKVNDADMIILVRKIDELQQNIVNIYYDYMTTRNIFDMSVQQSKAAYSNYQYAQNAKREILLIADAYYRETLDTQMKARSDFYSKRATLEQLVGKETFQQFEKTINERDY